MRELSGATSGLTVMSGSVVSDAVALAFGVADELADEPVVGVGVGAAWATTLESPITNAAATANPANSRRIAIIMSLSLPTRTQCLIRTLSSEHRHLRSILNRSGLAVPKPGLGR